MYTQESKCISYLLRHAANKLQDFEIDKNGWVNTSHLLEHCEKQGHPITFEILAQIVSEDKKGRYQFSDDTLKIRATQGHSVDVDLQFKRKVPPTILYHGTTKEAFELIKKSGIQKMNRHHVHLMDAENSKHSIGNRKNSSVVIKIDAKEMVKDYIEFFQSDNGVWLTDFVAPKYFIK